MRSSRSAPPQRRSSERDATAPANPTREMMRSSTAVRGIPALVLAAEGRPKCVEPARRHAIYTVLDPATAPRTLEEKLVYIADRRGGMTIESVEERAKETAARYPRFADEIARAIPVALEIEREVFGGLPFTPAQLAAHVAVP